MSEALRVQIDHLATSRDERLSVRQLAEASGMSSGRVAATLSGRRVPNRDELDMLCMALGLGASDREVVQRLRTREETERAHRMMAAVGEGARATEKVLRSVGSEKVIRGAGSGLPSTRDVGERQRQPVPAFGQPDPILVSSPEELIQALNAVHVWGGAPSLRELERRSKGFLRRSTTSDMLRGTALPDYDRYVVFLRACGVDGANLDTWVFVWRRLKALETPGAASWMPGAEDVA
ncbi:helix-turn-helix transcriptional regulator [Streptomyces sp. NPDC006334]|uniref:helix-turn-helix domain-containing protein n=1 Tax=Streptomyces sp. NPDC006334 TaxID=3156754 RepID=UPI0033B7FDC0